MARTATWYLITTQTRMGRPQTQARLTSEASARTLAQTLSLSGQFLAVKLYTVHRNALGLEAETLTDTWRNASAYTTREEYARSVERYGGVSTTPDEGDE